MRKVLPVLGIILMCLTSCHQSTQVAESKAPVVLHFQLDSTGAITDTAVIHQLIDIAVRISKNADRIMLHSYTEKMDSTAQEMEVATQMARAAKEAMAQAPVPRVFYNVGIDIHGSASPLDAAHPASAVNRRIEIEFL